jgi:4'-phosphopantetheinyl transferase
MKRALLVAERPRAVSRRRAPATATRPQLRFGHVDLWRVPLDTVDAEGVARLRRLLAGEEEERAVGFYFERDRRRFVVARGALRQTLSGYLGVPPREIAFSYNVNGKPRLADESAGRGLAFNVAHSDELALLAITRTGEVGVDVEHVRDLPDWEAIAAAFFSPAEQERLRACPAEDRRREFFRAWTRQEALLKATGIGLGGLDERGPEWRLTGEPAPRVPLGGPFRVFPFVPASTYVAALAVGPDVSSITCFDWSASPISKSRRTERRAATRSLAQFAHTSPKFL